MVNTWWFQAIGWIGSALVVFSLTRSNILRLRWLNLAGGAVSAIWNALAGIWPFAAMNLAICIINIYWLIKIQKEQHLAAPSIS